MRPPKFMSQGQGIKLEGYPTDFKKFYRILMGQSCHPKAVTRILKRIREKGFDSLTVRAELNFAFIKLELEKIGTTLSFIPALEDWTDKYEDGRWSKNCFKIISQTHNT